jgi:glycosyltransferase involved in cell wall biosynthesis
MSEAIIPFSIVIPLYNKEATVDRALRSVFNQTVQDFEIIVVNDGSTDNGARVVEAINDPRIRLIHQENRGVSAARNRGIAEARYELIAFLDADDEWLLEFLATIRRMVDRYPDCGLYATRYFLCSPMGKQQPAIVRGLPGTFEGILENYFKIAVRSTPPVWSSAVCAKKTVLTQIGGFPMGIAAGEDLLTWARIAIYHKVAYSTRCEAIFYLENRTNHGFKKPRTSVNDNRVGIALEKLAEENAKSIPAIRRYCSFWYRIRAATYAAWGNRSAVRHYALRGLRYYPDIKLAAYLMATYLPQKAVVYLQKFLRSQ